MCRRVALLRGRHRLIPARIQPSPAQSGPVSPVQPSLARFSPARPGLTRFSPARPGLTRFTPVRSIPILSGPIRSNPVQSSPARPNPTQPNPVHPSPVHSNPVFSPEHREFPVMNLGVRLCVRIFLSGCYGVPNVYYSVIQCVVAGLSRRFMASEPSLRVCYSKNLHI